MAHLEYWNFLSECGLLLSLIYFGYRFLRAPSTIRANVAQLQELQGGLRQAIREADEAGRALGDQFNQRKNTLEKLLFDLETIEARVNRAVTSAEERKGSLELEIKRAQHAQEEIAYASNSLNRTNSIALEEISPRVIRQQTQIKTH